jgi:hypothetical protein
MAHFPRFVAVVGQPEKEKKQVWQKLRKYE